MRLGGENNVHSLRITPTQVFVSDTEIGGIAALKYEEEANSPLGRLTLVLHVEARSVDIQLPDFDPTKSKTIKTE